MALEGKINAREKLQEALEGVRTLGDRLKDTVPEKLTTTVRLELDPSSRTTVLAALEAVQKEPLPVPSTAVLRESAWAREREQTRPSRPDREAGPTSGEHAGSGSEAPDGPAPSSQKARRLETRPHPRAWRRASWDGPEDDAAETPSRLKELAQEGWQKLRKGGALHTLRESGRFSARWGEFLEGKPAQEQRAWTNAAARPEGRAVSDAFEGIERAGSRIQQLLQEFRGGGEAALTAAEHLKKAREELLRVGDSGRRAAEALGGPHGESLREELARAQTAAGEGLAGVPESGPKPDSGGDSKPNPRRFLNLLKNPTGSALAALEEGLLSRYGGALSSFFGQGAFRAFSGAGVGGAAGTLGAAAAGAGAVAGGAYAGYRIQLGRANDTGQDAGKALEDLRLSQAQGFDYRGAMWDKDRLRTQDGTPQEAREILHGLGVSLRPTAFKTRNGLRSMTEDVSASADLLGMDAPKLASVAGAAMRSGTVVRGEEGIQRVIALLATWRDEALKHGVTLNERLGVLSQLSAQQVQQTGALTERGFRTLGEASTLMDRSGHPSLQGEAGAGVLNALTRADRTDSQKALLMGAFFDGKHLTPLGRERAQADLRPEDLKALQNAPEGEWGVTRALMETPSALLAASQATARRLNGKPLWLQQGMLGLERVGTVQSLRALEALRGGEDLTGTARLRAVPNGESEALQPEGRGARSVQASSVREEDARASTLTWEAARNLKDFSTDLRDAVRQFSQAVDNFGGYGQHPLSWKERGAALLLGSPATVGLGLQMMTPAPTPIPTPLARR